MKRKPKHKYRYVYQSAVTGLFVSKAYAARFPKKTFRQRVRLRSVKRG